MDLRRREEGPLDFLTNLEISVQNFRSSSKKQKDSSTIGSGGGYSPEASLTGTGPGGGGGSGDAGYDSSTLASTTTIGKSVRSQVDDCLWLDQLKTQYAELEEKRRAAGSDQDRCVVCTLPYGTCQHTRAFLAERIDDTEDVVAREVDELLSFVGPPIEVQSVPQEEDVDMDAIRWVQLDPALSDKIGNVYLSVHNPNPRGWHSCCRLQHYVVVFGGFRYKGGSVPQPFGPACQGEEVEYLCELLIFDTVARSWHQSPRRKDCPGGRYGHVAAALDDQRMLVFGGRSEGGRFLNDTWIYHLDEDRWESLRPNGASPAPSPRMFSAACSFAPSDRGRRGGANSSSSGLGASGVSQLSSSSSSSSSAAASRGLLHDVYLFGGTDGVDNFGDLWVFRGRREGFNGEGGDMQGEMRWERTVAAGIPPAPRYGHRLVAVREGAQTNTETNASHAHMSVAQAGRLVVVGGCTVSPQSEVVGTAMTTQEAKTMLDLGNSLQNSYLAEGVAAQYGGRYLESSAQMVAASGGRGSVAGGVTAATGLAAPGGGSGIRGLYGIAAGVTAHLHELETMTREAEKALVSQFHVMQASRALKTQRAKHPNALLDVIFLDVKDMMWKPQVYPRISGDVPCSRMHFGCVSVGGQIVVIGGTRPTSLAHKPVECSEGSTQRNGVAGKGGGGCTQIATLDLGSFCWTIRHAIDARGGLDVPLQIANSDILRASHRVQQERDRGKALGARNGMTIELAEAQAVLDVCKWRLKMLQRERDSLRDPPPARWGLSLDAVGCRAFAIGGWADEGIVRKGETYILDMEHDGERRRREADEFGIKLERDRKLDENNSMLNDMQSAYELRAMLQAEAGSQARERALMAVAEVLSSVPPLSVPAPVQLLQASDHSMWVTWERLDRNTSGQPIDPGSVRYDLYMVNGYQHLVTGDRVLVRPVGCVGYVDPDAEEGPAGGADGDDVSVVSVLSGASGVSDASRRGLPPARAAVTSTGGKAAKGSKGAAAKPSNPYADYDGPGFPGEITGTSPDDRFLVSFDDGTFEGGIHRGRISLARPVYPDRLPIPYGRGLERGAGDDDSTVAGDEDEDEEEEGEQDAQKRRGQQRGDALLARYGHLLNDLNREALTIGSSMSWATQKRIMAKLKLREGAIARLSRIHPSYKTGSITGTAAAATASGAAAASLADTHSLADDSGSGSDSEDGPEGADDDDSLSLPSRLPSPRGARASKRRHKGPFRPTITPPPELCLIYSGHATRYEVTGIVPLETLRRDPRLTVPVSFVLQTTGAEFPSHDSSQMSVPAVFRTRRMPTKEALLQGLADAEEDAEAGDAVLARLGGKKTEEKSLPVKSRTAKVLLETTLGGRVVRMEKQGCNVIASGEGEHFM